MSVSGNRLGLDDCVAFLEDEQNSVRSIIRKSNGKRMDITPDEVDYGELLERVGEDISVDYCRREAEEPGEFSYTLSVESDGEEVKFSGRQSTGAVRLEDLGYRG